MLLIVIVLLGVAALAFGFIADVRAGRKARRAAPAPPPGAP
jgi:hypothetical protein